MPRGQERENSSLVNKKAKFMQFKCRPSIGNLFCNYDYNYYFFSAISSFYKKNIYNGARFLISESREPHCARLFIPSHVYMWEDIGSR